MNAREYAVQISPLRGEDGGGFVAFVPDLPGCISDGATPEEALGNAYDAIESWIEEAIETGRIVPRPQPVLKSA